MKSFVSWLEEDGFYIKDDYDPDEGWISHSKLVLDDWEREIFEYLFTIDPETGKFPMRTIMLSTLKKTGKTTWGAAIGCWYAECGPDNSEIYVIANDIEQVKDRMFEDMRYHAIKKREEAGGKKIYGQVLKERITLGNGSTIQALAREYTSAAGSRQGLTLWDELWGYTSERSRRMWEEMTLPPTVKYPMKVIVTYAGYKGESDLLWDMYQDLVMHGEPMEQFKELVNSKGKPIITHKGKRFAMWDDQPRRPWQDKEYYKEQKEELRPMKFLQFHRNQWITSEESFIPEPFYDRSLTLDRPLMLDPDSDFRSHPISVGVDIGLTKDTSSIVGTYYDYMNGRVGVAFHYIWQGTAENPLDLEETVEKKLLELNSIFNIVAVLYDPFQFHRSATTLEKKGLPMAQYDQTVTNMTQATQNLYELYQQQRIDHYPDDELRDHIILAAAANTGRGYRLVKNAESGSPIDGAVALAMSAWDAVTRMGVDTSEKVEWELPFSDVSAIPAGKDTSQDWLPAPLRT